MRAVAVQAALTSPTAASVTAAPCSPVEFAALSQVDLLEAVAGSSASCLGSLWSFDSDVAAVASPSNVVAVSAAITSDSAALPATAARLTQLTYFFQIVFFHEFYQAGLIYDSGTFDAAATALVGLSAEAAFYQDTSEIIALRNQWIVSIDSTMATHRAVDAVQWMIQRYHDDQSLALDYDERVAAFAMFFTLARQVSAHASEGADSPWYSLISTEFVNLIAAVGLDSNYNDDTIAIVENALYALAQFSILDAPTAAAAHQALSDAYTTLPQFSPPWFRALLGLEWNFNSSLADGSQLDLDSLRQDVTAFALPNTFVFGQGRTVFRTAIDRETAASLYDAMQEVKSQFFRKTNFLDPVAGDRNETLTLVVYGSPGDYATYHPFLFGLPTNNGGIYIETDATLYTYDRTPQQSTYTLEELLRHEYVHYLVSRYLIAGNWGAPGSLYDDGRMVWYDEGLAEFFAGSTRLQGVLPRATLVDLTSTDAARMTVPEVMDADYGSGFAFYRYAGLLFTFLNSQQPKTLIELFDAVRSNDAAAVDVLWADLASDTALQTRYDAYLASRIAERQSASGVFTEDVPTSHASIGLASDNATAVRSLLEATLEWPQASFVVSADRYRYLTTLSRTVTAPEPEGVRHELDTWLDQLLSNLESQGTNFTSAVGWFGNIWTSGTTANATFAVEGPYLATATDTTAPATPTGVITEDRPGTIALSWTANAEADLAGYNVYRSEDGATPQPAFVRTNSVLLIKPEFVDNTISGGGKVYRYFVTSVDASGNESVASPEVTGSSSTSILVVNGYFDSGNDPRQAYMASLDELDVGYDVWDPFVDGEPSDSLLARYTDGLVIWAVGYFHAAYPGQLSVERQTVLTNYLDAGGNLMMSGAYVSNYVDNTDLLANYFSIDSVSNNVGVLSLEPTAQNPISLGAALQNGSTSYQSEIDVRPPAIAAYRYDTAAGGATIISSGTAIATVESGYRGVFLAFPFDVLASTSRRSLMENVLAWMLPAAVSAHSIPGDANGDGRVSAGDALLALSSSLQPGICGLCLCDVNNDGTVSATDALAILFKAVGAAVSLTPPAC